jgi:hypothetical protein
MKGGSRLFLAPTLTAVLLRRLLGYSDGEIHMAGGRRFNWSLMSSRERMHRQGVEDSKAKTPLVGPAPKSRRKLSKAELREQAEAALLVWRAARQPKTNNVRGLRQAGRTSARSLLLMTI